MRGRAHRGGRRGRRGRRGGTTARARGGRGRPARPPGLRRCPQPRAPRVRRPRGATRRRRDPRRGPRDDRSVRGRPRARGVDRCGGVALLGHGGGAPPAGGRPRGRGTGSPGDGALVRRAQRLAEPGGDGAVRDRGRQWRRPVRARGARRRRRAHRVRDGLRGDGTVARRERGAGGGDPELRAGVRVPPPRTEPGHGRRVRHHHDRGAAELGRRPAAVRPRAGDRRSPVAAGGGALPSRRAPRLPSSTSSRRRAAPTTTTGSAWAR